MSVHEFNPGIAPHSPNLVTRRSPFLLLFALLAAGAAAIFLAISVDHDVYAPGARDVMRQIQKHTDLRGDERGLPPRARRWLTVSIVLRKTYSIGAFAIVGFFLAPLLPRRVRVRGDAAAVAAFSTVIEVAQKATGSPEGYASNLFDIACGAVGGALGSLAWNVIAHRRVRDDAAP